MLLSVLLLTQETVHIARNDARRPHCETLLRRFAEVRLDEPRKAVEALDALLAEAGDVPVECRVRVERMANVFSEPVDFFPYQLRGRAKLALAAAEPARRRALLLEAIKDFERSKPSAAYLAQARAAFWEDLWPDLTAERWTPELVELARLVPGPAAWAVEEAKRVAAGLEVLPGAPEEKHPTARRASAWSEAMEQLFGPLAELKAVRERAAALLARRSRFRLQVSVTPFAELRLSADGKEVELDVRHTPLALTLEATAYDVELKHPRFYPRLFRIRAEDVKDGRTYVLTGDMESGELRLRELRR